MKRMKRWIVVPVLMGVLALGIVGAGTALAQTADSESPSKITSLASRVAAILGLDEATVQDALDQAHDEMQDERVQSHLDKLVENGRLTQEQADKYLEWYRARPEGLRPGFGFGRGFKGPHGGFGHHRGGHFLPMAPAAVPQSSGNAA